MRLVASGLNLRINLYLRDHCPSLPNGVEVMAAFEKLIRMVSEHQREAGDLVGSEDIMGLFRPLIPEPSIDIDTRLRALSLLKSVSRAFVYHPSIVTSTESLPAIDL